MILTITMNPALDRIYVVDDFNIDKIFRINNMEINAAGKGVNVARVAKILGENVIASGVIGGRTGDYINEEMNDIEVESNFWEIKGNTRTCVKVVDNKNNTTTELLESGPELTRKEREIFLSHYEKLLDNCEVIAACGSLPEGVSSNFYSKLIKIAHNKKAKFILDTSGTALEKGIEQSPFMIKPNQDEIHYLMGKKYNKIEEYINPLLDFRKKGIELPVITLGEKGCVALINNKVIHFSALNLEIKNVVGSGDAFIAGCAAALNHKKYFKEVIKLGMACAHANTQFYKTGMISQDLVDKYYQQQQYKIIKEV